MPMNKTDFVCGKSHFQRVLQLKFVLDNPIPATTTENDEPNLDYLNEMKAEQLTTWI